MTKHLNLLDSVPGASHHGLPWWSGAAIAGAVILAAGAYGTWSHINTNQLRNRLDTSERAIKQVNKVEPSPLDATVLDGLRRTVESREKLAKALSGVGSANNADSSFASRWLDALDQIAAEGLSLNQVRVETGDLLSVKGSALQPQDINNWLNRLQQNPLTGTAPIGQLEMKRGEKPGDPISFRIIPPAYLNSVTSVAAQTAASMQTTGGVQ
jgi:hypothetical protein